ncbi:MAG: sulfatase-like hydrolase/transferase [Planctomycetaceae bacterium]
MKSCRFPVPLVCVLHQLTASACLVILSAMSSADVVRPNVILIVSDDQGYHDLGCLSHDAILTPSLDRLAAEGVRLTDFSVAWPACTPSRGAFLTGRYPQRNGIFDMIRNEAPDFGYRYRPGEYDVSFERIGGMDVREVLLPELLGRAGYRSAIYGKWDLGSLKRFLPTSRGFDHFFGFVNTGIDYFTHERYGVPSMYRDRQLTDEGRGICCTKLFGEAARQFISENRDRPFFLYLPFNSPHNASSLDPRIRGGAQASESFLKLYPELQQQAKFQTGTKYGKPAEVPNPEMRRLLYCAAVSEMDAEIGRILEQLDQSGIADRTLVIFFSDNGGSGGADNTPLRGHKSQMWEGGLRVPCIVKFPNRIPAGTVNSEFLTSLEVFPTILAACQVEPPSDLVLDGDNMLPVLQGTAPSPRKAMFWQRRTDRAVRVGSWKLVDSASGSGLFDLSRDIHEAQNLSGAHPEKVIELERAFEAWKSEMDAAEPRGPFRDF